VDVSAKTGQGVPQLLEMIALQSELLELKANPKKRASGVVIEARLEKGRGPVATVLVSEGTIKVGDFIVTGVHHGRVRAMLDDLGRQVAAAPPSIPVEVLGIDGVPTAGDTFNVVVDEKQAKAITENRRLKAREAAVAKTSKVSLADLDRMIAESGLKELKVIVKADVQGSAEAVTDALNRLQSAEVKVKVILTAVGGITESDVNLAAASNAIIVGFNVRPEPRVQVLAEQEKVEIRNYSIIYELVDDVKKAMTGLLSPVQREQVLGRAEIRQIFNVPKIGTVAGCAVVSGKVTRIALVRLLRDSKVVYSGRIGSLRRFKDDAREVLQGYECGIGIEGYNDLKPGDVLEAYEIQEVAAELSINVA
jgi:translation initiation factor IF-2